MDGRYKSIFNNVRAAMKLIQEDVSRMYAGACHLSGSLPMVAGLLRLNMTAMKVSIDVAFFWWSHKVNANHLPYGPPAL